MAIIPAVYKSSINEAFFTLLTFTPTTGPVLRVVNNNEDVVSRGIAYAAFPFSIVLAASDGETIPTLTVTIDAIDQQIIELIREFEDPPAVKLEIVLSSSPDTVEKTVDFLRLIDVQYDAYTVTGRLQQDNFLNLPAVDSIYSGNEFPDLVI